MPHRTVEFERKHAVLIASQPAVVAEPRHDRRAALPDRGMIVRGHELVGPRRTHEPSPSPTDASARRAAVKCGMSYILPSMPTVPTSGLAAKAATTRRAGGRGASEGGERPL